MRNALARSIIVLLGSAALSSTSVGQGYLEVTPYDASISALEKGLRPSLGGNHHAILLAMRQLRDPDMRPLFQRLLSSEDPALQIDGLLALAEVGGDSIDPFLLKGFAPQDRTLAILAAIDLDLLDARSTRAILEFENLTPVEYLNLAAHGSGLGLPADQARLRTLATGAEPSSRLVAAGLLAEAGDGAVLEGAQADFDGLSIGDRERVAAAFADIASRNAMPASLPLLERIWKDELLSRGTRLAAIDAALQAGTSESVAVWVRAGESAENSGDRMRLGVIGLVRGVRHADWSPFGGERRLPRAVAALGEAIHADANVEARAVELVGLKNAVLMEGALAVADRSDARTALAIRKAVLDLTVQNPETRGVGMRMLTEIADRHPEELESILRTRFLDLEDQGLIEMALMGLLNAREPRSRELGELFLDHPDRRVRSFALLLVARSDRELDSEQLEHLGELAAGAGGIDPTVRAMAAWTWLERSDNRERAVTRLMGGA